MPQLNLVWFLFNFGIAWLLVFLMIILIVKQDWFTNESKNNNENININLTNNNNEWVW